MSIVDNVVGHINTPGSALKLVPIIQVIVLMILAGCSVTIYYGVAVIHMCVMIFLALGLLVSLTFLQKMVNDAGGIPKAQDAEEESDMKKID
ncbi:hypothetical protein TL16_g04042 [Triparma laevis f. inornata]|uniref:Uncharacterized protein n=2 Tax=Triparma laevis TaxID=1534972 RepID=A0A9W6ZXU2_9STRA|nr:hypothetical protein TrLO_g7383 [Triparma laevis f. longispina]GMH64783.1 hypothetical protein TL16_g04042 [Triparma laevis f. inornata]